MATPLHTRAFLKSLAAHGTVLAIVLVLPAGPLRQSAHPDEVEVVFHPPERPIEVPLPVIPLRAAGTLAAGPKAPLAAPVRPAAPATPAPPAPVETAGVPEGPPEVVVPETPRQKVGKSGLLAFRDQIASVAQEQTPNVGTGTRLRAADDTARGSSGTLLSSNAAGGSGGIDLAGLTREVGGGGGGGAGGGLHGVAVGRASSSIAGIGGGGRSGAAGGGGAKDGSGAHTTPGNARTDEEIQIVFDRHKASFYRLYHKELRVDPTLRGQIVVRLTIEPDGSVSACSLQSSDMKAPDLAAQVLQRVREINFGPKDGVQTLTIVYPIDFLPAA
jgi:TonB family protein